MGATALVSLAMSLFSLQSKVSYKIGSMYCFNKKMSYKVKKTYLCLFLVGLHSSVREHMGIMLDTVFLCITLCNSEITGKSTNMLSSYQRC